MLKLLIVEGNTKEGRDLAVEAGSQSQSDLYKDTLMWLRPDADSHIVYPADKDAHLPIREELEKYDGIIWTGSSLNIYEDDPAITRQVDFMKSCFEHKTKIFGSCWGLQVAVVATGGKVVKNRNGREIGIARNIHTTQLGQTHPLYRGKTGPFDAVAVHLDHVEDLPTGATVLSGNEMSEVQALEIRRGNAIFWGVQYHPEFDLKYMAYILQKYKKMLIDEDICENEKEVDQLSTDYDNIHNDHSRDDLKVKLKVNEDVLDPCVRLHEVNNWLEFVEQSAR